MQNFLSQRITSLQESATIRMAKLSRELKAQGKDIVDLTLGEPDFDTPAHIREAAKKAIDEGFTHYTPVPGYAELRKAIAAKLKRDNGLDYTPEQIVVSTGAKHSIANVILSLINPGDEVLLPSPYWVSYASLVQLAGGVCIEVPAGLEHHFKVTAAELERHISPRTKLIIYSSPCNPTGAVFSLEELKSIGALLQQHPGIFVLSDEIYEYINFTGRPHASLAMVEGMKERVVVVNGFSKGFAMTGWRLGYIAAPLPIAQACDKMQSQFTSATCSIAQKAAECAAIASLDTTFSMVGEFRRRRDLVYELLKEIKGLKVNLPDGAFYFFPDVSSYFGKSAAGKVMHTPEDIAMYLLQEGGVGVVSGEAFGDQRCLRISYASDEKKLREGCARLKAALDKLN